MKKHLLTASLALTLPPLSVIYLRLVKAKPARRSSMVRAKKPAASGAAAAKTGKKAGAKKTGKKE